MSRGFIRVFYGEDAKNVNQEFKAEFRKYIVDYYSSFISEKSINNIIEDNLNKHLLGGRMDKIKKNIAVSLGEKNQFPFVCYTFGIKNHEYLLSLGVNSILVHDFPNPFYMYRHKLEALKLGMADFDEIVFLDWDIWAIKEIDDEFWNLLGKKDIIQASLSNYRHSKLSHRNGKQNKYCPSGAFMYCRDKSLPARIIELWKKESHFYSNEVGIARITDELMGGWDGQKYYDRFEPYVFTSPTRNRFQKDPNKIYIKCKPGGK